MRQPGVVIIGVDCATEPRKVGLARGLLDYDGHVSLQHASLGSSRGELVELIVGWMRESPASLLALDAPLGWPAPLGGELSAHRAGGNVLARPDDLFLRETDRSIWNRLGKRPLEVGADRIARTAVWALCLLRDIRERTRLELPLAWKIGAEWSAAAIEVYPVATMRAAGMKPRKYKGNKAEHVQGRRALVKELRREIELGAWSETLEASDDALDAAVCVLAGADFMRGRALPPADLAPAKREGWIWCRDGRAPRTGER